MPRPSSKLAPKLAPIAAAITLILAGAAHSAQTGHASAGVAAGGATGSATTGSAASGGTMGSTASGSATSSGSASIGSAPAGGGSPSSAIGNSSAGGSAAIGNAPAGGGSPSAGIGSAGAGGGNTGNSAATTQSGSVAPGTSIGTDTAATVTGPTGFNRVPASGAPSSSIAAERPDPTLPEDANDNAKARADAPPSARP